MDDCELLREYVERQSESAFAELVRRHIDLVYSTALRMVREPALAEDVAQAVFVQFARKAPDIQDRGALPAWLYRVTQCQAANAVRDERTRREHELEAITMTGHEDESSASWERIAPHLEEAMNTLSEAEQNALLQRFFQGRSWREVGTALALSEDAAQKRVSRSLEKLRAHLMRRGITVSASVIGLAVAAHAVQAAPLALVSSVTAASLAGTVGVGASTVASTTLKAFLMKKSTIGVLAVLAISAAVTTPFAISKIKQARLNAPVTEKDLRQGLVLHMSFDRDETGDNKITDTSGAGNHGKASGVRWTADGKVGGAYEFTADGNEIVVPNNESLNPEDLTLSAWIKTSTGDHFWRRIFDKAYSQGFALSVAGDWQQTKSYGQVCMEIGPGAHSAMTKIRVDDGQWHHVVTTFDGTAELIYVDGQPQGKFLWNRPDRVGATEFNLVIGCNRSNLDKKEDDLGVSFRGLIDEPMMWDRALSPKEVAFLFESQNAPLAGKSTAN